MSAKYKELKTKSEYDEEQGVILNQLGKVTQNIRETAIRIGDELDGHSQTIDGLGDRVTKTNGTVEKRTNRMNKILESGERYAYLSICVLVILIILFVLLIVIQQIGLI